MNELKLLPCSCEAEQDALRVQSSDTGTYRVGCKFCCRSTDWHNTPENAKKAWNRMRRRELRESGVCKHTVYFDCGCRNCSTCEKDDMAEVMSNPDRPKLNKKTLDRINELVKELAVVKSIERMLTEEEKSMICGWLIKSEVIRDAVIDYKIGITEELKQLGYEEEE